jgi:hypothetical protein
MKGFVLLNILHRLAFYFNFQKNQKNLIDLIKLVLIIITVCHIFCALWHGLALYEINVLKRTDTWIHAQNLIESPVHIRYFYSFYYLAATMITVGYGDVVPKNYIECVFSVITMFFTGMVYAYSLNCIGMII